MEGTRSFNNHKTLKPMKKSIVAVTLAFLAAVPPTHSQTMIGKNNITLQSDRMTPEALWAMGRVGGAQASPDGRKIVYRVGYYLSLIHI